MYTLRGNEDPVPWLHCCFLAAPPLFLHPLPSLISNCLNLPFGTQGRGHRKAFVPRSPTGSCLVSIPHIAQISWCTSARILLEEISRNRIVGNRLVQLYQIMLNTFPKRLQCILPLAMYESSHAEMFIIIS